MTCRALIVKEFKTVKANSVRSPEPFVNPNGHPICGGKLRFAIDVYRNWGGDAEVTVAVDCSRCKNPYFTGMDDFHTNPIGVLERLLNNEHQDELEFD